MDESLTPLWDRIAASELDEHFARANTRTHWVVPRPGTLLRRLASAGGRSGRVAGRAPLIAAVCLVAVGCGQAELPLAEIALPKFVHAAIRELQRPIVPITVMAILSSMVIRRQLGRWGPGGDDPEFGDAATVAGTLDKLDPYALILLAHGPEDTEAVQAAVIRLVDEGVIEFDPSTGKLAATAGTWGMGRPLHPVEQMVRDALQDGEPREARDFVARRRGSRAIRRLRDDLRAGGWIRPSVQAWLLLLISLVPIAAAVALGVRRGMQRQWPAETLIVPFLAMAMAGLCHLACRPWRSTRGEHLLASLRRWGASRPWGDNPLRGLPAPSDPHFLRAFALLRLDALSANGPHGALRAQLTPPVDSGGGGG